MAIELVPLTVATFKLREPIPLPECPSGMRMIVEVETATFDGERLSGKLKGVAAADWLTVAPDGTGTLDVRVTIETHDGALVFTCYRGKVDFSKTPGEAPIYSAPLYETGDPRYAWLNKVQAIAKGTLDPVAQTITYDIYEVR